MKSYFERLFNYDCHANRQIAELIQQYPENRKPAELMAHLLIAQQTWLKRCKGLPAPGGPLWPDWHPEEILNAIDQNHEAIIAYLEILQPADFETLITFKNLQGISCSDKLTDILAHLINHGTHHRAQAGQYFKLSGAKLPASDYILYTRQL